MATSRVSPPRRPIQLPSTSLLKGPDQLAVPKYHIVDPLLGHLSPESTLQALSSTDAVPKNEQAAHDILSKSISQASPTDRALGIRAAVAAQKLGQWYREVQEWEWPKRANVHLGKRFIPPSDAEKEAVYCGSLPATVVEDHEKRIEEIRDGMESLDVEELKEHVLNAHIPGRSRPSSANSTMSLPPPLSYVQLSDFTAVITATILRALPLLSRLNSILSTWSVRLLVLRQIPGLLHSLRFARSELNSALDLLKSQDPPTENDTLYSIANYHARRIFLESTVLSAGRRMDRILDSLDGREDSLPESWIDDLEAMEAEFGNWVMQAEKRTVENEWRRLVIRSSDNDRPQSEMTQPGSNGRDDVKEPIAQTPNCQPVEPAPLEPSDPTGSIFTPEPVSQNRPAPLQTGRTPLMETIAEEISSPFEPPLSHNADVAISLVEARTTRPISPSSLPSGLVDTREALGLVPIMELDASCETAASLDQPQENIEIEEDTPIPSDALPLEDSSRLPKVNDKCPPAELSVEMSIISLGEETLVPTAIHSDEPRLEELQPSTGLDTRSASLPSPESVRAEPVQQDDESPSRSSSEEPCPLPQAPLLEQAEMAILFPRLVEDSAKSASGSAPRLENLVASSANIEPVKIDKELKLVAEVGHHQPAALEGEAIASRSAETESASPDAPALTYPKRCQTPPDNAVASLANLFVPVGSSKPPTERPQSPVPEQQSESTTLKKPLESPIKLSKTRPGRLDLEHNSESLVRRISNASDGSLSDYPSFVSTPEIPEPRTGSSNGTPLLVETPPHFPSDYRQSDSVRQNNDHTLREDHLFHLDAQKSSPREPLTHNRTLSLPLQRFINERLEMNYDQGSGTEEDSFTTETSNFGKKVLVGRRQKSKSTTFPSNTHRFDGQRLALTREESSGPAFHHSNSADRQTLEQSQKALSKNTTHSSAQAGPPSNIPTARLKKKLTAHPSLESIGPYKSNTRTPGGSLANRVSTNIKYRPSSPIKQLIRPKDQMDEKINSILTTLPGGIHIVPADQDDDAVSVGSSLPFRRERFRSSSPQGTPSRSPTPSLALRRGLGRRRYSHAPEESSVKLYHLHRGGKSAPTKLFVRTVGENGERVMVRVGGGWADLAEYLREYAIHHGRRHVSETPRVEVEGLSSRESPSYSPPGSRIPTGSGRQIPARPRSVISNRPPSSLAVRKTRRSSNVSDMTDFRTVSAGDALNVSFSPTSAAFGRRLSVSSNLSAGAVSSASEIRHGSPSTIAGGTSHAMPLGLAGPKPRAKHATISPESEAWVEDVLGQARRSSSLRPFKFGPPPQENDPSGNTPTLPKSRSIGDIGKAGSSKRVALRGLR